MPGSTDRHKPSRLTWLIPAIIAAVSFIGGVAGNLVASDLDAALKPYRKWVWAVCVVALIIAVVGAVKQGRRPDKESAEPEDEKDETKQQPQHVVARRDGETLVVTIPHEANALHQLPPPPRDFTGREAELAELRAQIEKGGANISGLRGLGGIGKTTLALKLAEELKLRYPDAQFYLDLKGASQKPLTVAEALSHVIRAYQPTARLPESEAELRALYLSVLDGKRALVLMDNASGREQVEPLIPPDGCVLLVTSRLRFTLPGLFAKDLDTLSPDDARSLLLKIAPRVGEQADTIAKLCDYLPLALRLAASALAERANLTAADYVRRLEKAQKRLELVEASLTLSYDLLSPELQRLWRTLSVFPDTFDTAAAAAVWETETDAAQDTLGELIRYSLVDWSDETTRHRLHDLARLFAAARLNEEERSAGQLRHATHYLSVLQEANELYKQGGEAIKRGLTLFDLEWRNIQAGQSWAENLSAENDAAASLCSGYPDAGVYLLSLRQHPREQIRWREAALAAARRLKDRGAEGAHLGNLGSAYFYLGDYHRAIEFYEQQLVIVREIGDEEGESKSLSGLGITHRNLGELSRAIEYHEQALAISRKIGDRRGEGSHLNNLGAVYRYLGKPRRAIEFYKQVLEIAREMGDRHSEGSALGNLGEAYSHLDETRRAIGFYEQALIIDREIGDRRGEGATLFNTSLALDKLGDRAQASAHAEAALKIFEQIESPHVERVRAKIAEWRGQE